MLGVPMAQLRTGFSCPDRQEEDKGTYLGTSDAISTRETAATGSTLRGTQEGSVQRHGVTSGGLGGRAGMC